MSTKVEKSVVKKYALIVAVFLATSSTCTDAWAFGWNLDRDAAESAMQSHNFNEAEKHWQDALKQLSGANDPRYGSTIRGLADVYVHEGNSVAAEKIYAETKQKVGASSTVDEGLLNCLSDYQTLLNVQNRSAEAGAQSSYYSTPSIGSEMRSYRSTPSASSLMRSYGSGFSSSDNANLSSYSTSSYSAPSPSVSQTIRSEPGITASSWYHH